MRQLILVLGDQLDAESAAFDDADPGQDAVWMAEVYEEATHVWSTKARLAVFFGAMRHFRDGLREAGWTVHYDELPPGKGGRQSLATALAAAIKAHRPERLVLVQPGEYRVAEALRAAADEAGVPLDIRPDRHFLCSIDDFNTWAEGRKGLRMEFFYREMRKQYDVLMTDEGPEGGKWNYDPENRESFGKEGPRDLPKPVGFKPDEVTAGVIEMINSRFSGHPGTLDDFDWPVTQGQARRALTDFIQRRLPDFGAFQDAMWTAEPWLYHSRISSSLNLKLLNPREVIAAAEAAYHDGAAPLAAVEGFIRQVLGWREYVRGVYWRFMPEYLDRNELHADRDLPGFYWDADTEMRCLHASIGQTLRYGYAHHIQRLMVTGLFALLLGVHPRRVHEWYLAVYVDAVEWVELPNVLGMSQYADGGVMASKPYAATGKYIKRMSNYCAHCPYNPDEAVGDDACPFTTLYWDFLMRHETALKKNQRMALQVRNIGRLSDERKRAIRARAGTLRDQLAPVLNDAT